MLNKLHRVFQKKSTMSFPYKCVLLIGATSGIGAGMAEKLIREGSKVVAVGRRQDRIDQFVRKHGNKAGGLAYDIGDSQNLGKFVNQVTSSYPDIDCVFLNAGVQAPYDLTKPDKIDLAAFHKEVSINFTSFVNLSLAFLPFLEAKQSPTSIVYTGSNLAIVPAWNMPAYSASKAALNCFTLCLRDQLTNAGSNVKVLEVSPPPVQTELHDYMGQEKGRALGMPLDQFCDQAYDGLAQGLDQVIIGSIGPQENFLDIVNKRRGAFDFLAKMMRSH
ncbi:MAG: hypothetical protein LQ345_005988 [Seirophora villosa]|nr:MAG: hypothetical protein LQ345_005988 [Seirophora villosa]